MGRISLFADDVWLMFLTAAAAKKVDTLFTPRNAENDSCLGWGGWRHTIFFPTAIASFFLENDSMILWMFFVTLVKAMMAQIQRRLVARHSTA
jgi:hypothetical protein